MLGKVERGKVVLNEAGRMVERVWREMPARYAGVEIDAMVVMPNHVHGIVLINKKGRARGPAPTVDAERSEMQGPAPTVDAERSEMQGPAPTIETAGVEGDAPVCPRISLPDVMQRFKSFTTACYRQGVHRLGRPPFPGRLWQRGYYDRIIRAGDSLAEFRRYILNNPLHWPDDPEHPSVRRE